MSASSRNSPSHMDDAGVTRWDRPRWISVFSSHNPTIREVTECLGLGLSASSSTTNRGIPKFDNPEYRKLSGEVTRLSKELPKERDALLDFAANPNSLHNELEELLKTFGTAIWGRNTDRSCLLTPDPAKKTYPRDLFIEDPEDKEILKIHLHRWIIIKACYYIRNMKLKRPSSANDYDTLADMEADGDPNSPNKPQLSPNGTPQSRTPSSTDGPTTAGAEFAVKPINGKKRKSSAFASLSDGDEMDSTPAAKRYQSHTMPLSRNSPRKSIFSIVPDGPISEHVPPVPSLPHSHANASQAATNGASPSDSTRPQLTTLSSNDLNGTPRPPNPAQPANGFTAVNTGGFTSINASPPVKDSPSQKPAVPAPHVNGRNYSSPYDSSSFHGVPLAQKASTPPKAPPLVTATAPTSVSGFQAINSPVVGNGVSARNSPNFKHVQPPQLPSQHTTQAQAQAQLQPTSRSNTPVMHHHHRPGLTQQRSSRSSTPIAPSVTSQPHQQVQPAQPAPAPAPAHQSPRSTGVPIAQAPPQPPASQHIQPVAGPRVHHVNVPPVPSVPAGYNPSQAPTVLRGHPHEATTHPAQAMPQLDLGLLQCEVLGSLIQYLFPKPMSPPDENVLLHKMETLWVLGAPYFSKEIGQPQPYETHSNVLRTWIAERRKIAQLRHNFTSHPAVPAGEMIERLLALNDLRMMRLKWKNMSSNFGLSTEDVLCRTFTIMTNTAGTEYLFKDGLDKLNDGIFEFLKTSDMRILMHTKR
ncbi:hypothetical protein BU23DRAFT_564220 [Bimuria novae-zelandiae CBS 107.79]|uniref:Uncharacterized protein n=1 Tax=Bimuria novae-zelandiae CBS 107.79 TaxID=1447943 RepID=A0A6A5VPH4_9PLEO|nr:hypothetical protein BU23DRAFT_564220 [Bimuria novae-zelandiae CBS 107.79]